jgi:DNA-binding SARP family transcriptional activator
MSVTLPGGTAFHPQPVVGLLGPIVVFRDVPVAVPAKLDRVVLAHLALAEGRSVAVGMLIDAVWDDHPPLQARNALQVKISRLRAQLGDHGPQLIYAQGTYRLELRRDQVDSGAFTFIVKQAGALFDAGEHTAAREALDQALAMWRGTPLIELDEHPRLVAARAQLMEAWFTAQELMAEVDLTISPRSHDVLSRLRKTLDRDPFRPKARLLLMRALETAGRRAEALAVYDAGRRLLADQSGLAPSPELQEAFESLLLAERVSARRPPAFEVTQAAPPGAIDTARWLAGEGEATASVQLALRGAWWWWFGGQRSAGRDLFEELLGADSVRELDTRVSLRASAWLAVFQAVEADAEQALRSGEDALRMAGALGWSDLESLAALLLAERLYLRGQHKRAQALVDASREQFGAESNEWGLALAGVVEAKALLLRGHVQHAGEKASALVREFEELGDRAGQIMALDAAGYCSEVQGDLASAARMHRRALDLARRIQAPEWETSQLTRLGSVLALAESGDALPTLESAVNLASNIKSNESLAFARNGLALAAGLAHDADRSTEIHLEALSWYEKQDSAAGVSYTSGRLSWETQDPQRALALARKSVSLAVQTGDPRAIAHGLEALAVASDDPARSAQALGGARALRRQTQAPLPAVLRARLINKERELVGRLGDDLVRELRAGAGMSRRLRARSHSGEMDEADIPSDERVSLVP